MQRQAKSVTKRAILSFCHGLTASLFVLFLITFICMPVKGFCSPSHDKALHRHYADSTTGLDPQTLTLANRGNWRDAVERMEQFSSENKGVSGGGANKKDAWLSFGYLYLRECEKLSALSKRFSSMQGYDAIIAAFDACCHGKQNEAQKILEALPERLKTTDPVCTFALAAIASKRGQSKDAVTYLKRTVALAPDFAWAYRTLGFLLERPPVRELDAAQAAYEKALAIEPDLPDAYDALVGIRLARNDFDGAIDQAKAAMKFAPKDAMNHDRLAQIYIQQHRLREAVQELDRAIKLAPQNARFYRNKAVVERAQGNLNDAIVDQTKACELSNSKAFELAELAAMNIAAGNKNRAIDNLEEAIKIEPNNNAAHAKLVALLNEEKRYDDLILEYGRAIQAQESQNAAAKKEDGDNHNAAQGQAAAQKMEALHQGLAQAYMKMGKFDQAAKEFVVASNLAPNDPQPHRDMGALRIAQKNYDAAAKEYTRALNLNSNSVNIPDMVALGTCYTEGNNYMEAEAAFVTVLALQQLNAPAPDTVPSRLDVMWLLANLLLKEGRYSDAANQFDSIAAMEKSESAAALAGYRLAQCRCLQDLTSASAANLLKAYDKLKDDVKATVQLSLCTTLLKAGKTDLARALIQANEDGKSAATGAVQLQQQAEQKNAWLLARAQYYSMINDAAKASNLAYQVAASKTATPAELSCALAIEARIELDKGDIQTAQATAKKAINTYSKNVDTYLIAAKIALKKGDMNLATEFIKDGLDQNPYDAYLYVLMGDVQMQAGNRKDALTSYRKAVDLYPALSAAHRSLLAALKQLGTPDEVKKEEEEAKRLESGR